ncbi:hypothetical protein GT354_31035 [Streptomyces sp. SID3343]|nr:hypothetical protein [Streptomyces sp. SID3343]
MRIACRTHRTRGRDGCVIPSSIGPALISARSIEQDLFPGLPCSAERVDRGGDAEYAGYAELDEETLVAIRLFAAEDMLAAAGAYIRDNR